MIYITTYIYKKEYCVTKKYLSENTKLMQEFDFNLNEDVNPYTTTSGSKIKVWWKCKICGYSWKASISDRALKTSSCPSCLKHIRTSFPEQAIFYYVKQVYSKAISQYKSDFLNKMELDIFIPEINYAIEYDGSHWHTTKNIQHEKQKYQLCKHKNIKLIRIKEGINTDPNNLTADYIFMIEKKGNKIQLTRTIESLLQFIIPNKTYISVDLTRDEREIREMYLSFPKNSLKVTEPEITKEWDYTKNGNITPSNITQYASYKAHWICSKCGKSFESTVANRTFNKSGCPYCTHQKVITGINDFATSYPELAKEWDTIKNEKLKPSEVSAHSNKKVWWICSNRHSFLQSIHNRSEGQQCPYCSSRKLLSRFNDLATINPNIASEWHPIKNAPLTPCNIMPGSNKRVWWICKTCKREWQASVNNRCNKSSGCPYCSGNIRKKGENDLATLFPELLKEWDYQKNNNLPNEYSPKSAKKVWWICSRCRQSWQRSIRIRTNTKSLYCDNCKKKLSKHN